MGQNNETDTGGLVQELARLQRRAARQKRNIKSGPEAWRAWAATMDEIADATKRLVVRPADDLDTLAAKFNAILGLIEANGSLLDSGDLRRLRRFGRDLSVIAGGHS